MNDNLAVYFHQRVADAVEAGTPLGEKELNAMLTLLRQNQISAPAVTQQSTADRARAEGRLNFEGLAEKRKVVPFRRPAPPEPPAGPDHPGESEAGA